MIESIKMWKSKLSTEISEESRKEMSLERLELMDDLACSWMHYNELETQVKGCEECSTPAQARLSEEEIKTWCDNMLNADGTKGPYWSLEQTTALAGTVGVYFQNVTPSEWWAACNMKHSDDYAVAVDTGNDSATFYGKMAKAFLLDRDGGNPSVKLANYYRYVVKPAMH